MCSYPEGLGQLRRIKDGRVVFRDNRKVTNRHKYMELNQFGEEYINDGMPVTHFVAKGSTVQAKQDVKVFTGGSFGNTKRHLNALFSAQEYVRRLVDNKNCGRREVNPYYFRKPDGSFPFKDKDTGPGEPFCVLGGSYGVLLDYFDEEAKAMLADMKEDEDDEDWDVLEYSTDLEDKRIQLVDGTTLLFISYEKFRDSVLAGNSPIVTFYVHSKEDKYKHSKIISDAFRTIQGTDLFFFIFMKEFLDGFKEALYADRDHWIIDPNPYQKMEIMERFREKYTTGIDYTAFDRYQSPQVICSLFECLIPLGLDSRAAAFIAQSICWAPLSFHGGSYTTRLGGNPSGQYWTTVVNCFAHTAYIAYSYIGEDGLVPCDLFMNEWLVHGDDELAGFDTQEEAEEYIEGMLEVQEEIGQIIKAEKIIINGETSYVFPPKFTAPFLGCTIQYVKGGVNYSVPVNPSRRVPFVMQKEVDGDNYKDVVRGVYNSLVALDVYPFYNGSRVRHPLLRYLDGVAKRVGVETLDSAADFLLINCTDPETGIKARQEAVMNYISVKLFRC